MCVQEGGVFIVQYGRGEKNEISKIGGTGEKERVTH